MIMKHIVGAALVLSMGVAMATPVNVTFTGQWWAQANTVIGGAQQVPISVPVDFSITMRIDPEVNSFTTFVVNANYMTRFQDVNVESAVTQYGLENPYGEAYASGSYATVSRFTANYAPFKIESQNFGLRELSGTTFADGGNGQWEMQLRVTSPNIPVDLIRPINGADLMASFAAGQAEQRQYNIYYEKSATVFNTSAATGYPYTGYIGGIALNGYATITAVTQVPEAPAAWTLLAGLLALAAKRKTKVARQEQ